MPTFHTKKHSNASVALDRWIVDLVAMELKPNASETAHIIDFLANRPGHDYCIRFVFSPSFTMDDIYIHQTRLEYAKGPLANLAKNKDECFTLDDQDDPRSFTLMRRYLYAQSLPLSISVHDLLQLVQVAHRWGVYELVRAVCVYVEEADLLAEDDQLDWVNTIVKAAAVVKLAGIKPGFIDYFWRCVGTHFENFVHVKGRKRWGGELGAQHSGWSEWSGFPGLWDLALQQGMVKRVLQCAKGNVDVETMEEFLEVIMVYLEPQIASDEEVSALLFVLGQDVFRYGRKVVKEGIIDRVCSVRAMRLLALSVFGKCKKERARKIGIRSTIILSMQLILVCMVRRLKDEVEVGEQKKMEDS